MPRYPTDVYRRMGALIIERYDPDMLMSRATQICRTWRSHLAWHLSNALKDISHDCSR